MRRRACSSPITPAALTHALVPQACSQEGNGGGASPSGFGAAQAEPTAPLVPRVTMLLSHASLYPAPST